MNNTGLFIALIVYLIGSIVAALLFTWVLKHVFNIQKFNDDDKTMRIVVSLLSWVGVICLCYEIISNKKKHTGKYWIILIIVFLSYSCNKPFFNNGYPNKKVTTRNSNCSSVNSLSKP